MTGTEGPIALEGLSEGFAAIAHLYYQAENPLQAAKDFPPVRFGVQALACAVQPEG